MKCPLCGVVELIADTCDLPYTYKGETAAIPAVTGEFCPACAESILDGAESERVMREMQEPHLAFGRGVACQTKINSLLSDNGN
jgi:HTH-type transcriptional regulator/antitoxin MqsA